MQPLAPQPGKVSDWVAATVRQMIVDGSLAPGVRLNEVQLAARLGVSRTPLREALARLAAEGALTSIPRIGYSVRPLSLEEFRQIYPIRALLDPEALRLAGVPAPARIGKLEKLNQRLSAAREVEDIIARDNEWHLELLAGCPNRALIELIEQFMGRTMRYEIALMRESRNVAATMDTHDRILAALRADDLERACTMLRANMQDGAPAIEAWLAARETERARG